MPQAYTMLLKEQIDKETQNAQYYLEESPNLPIPKNNKVYGNIDSIIKDRVFTHYRNCGNKTTGILSLGHPGTGKTILLNRLSQKCREVLEIPTVLITKAPSELSYKKIERGEGEGGLEFLKFIRDLPRCLIAIDEFDKIFSMSQQELLLTLYDGAFTSKKIIAHTANEIRLISEKLLSRPNRIFYTAMHGSIGPNFIREFCFDNLHDTSKIEDIVEVSKGFKVFTVDELTALVEEVNNHLEGIEESVRYLNLTGTGDYSPVNYKISAVRANTIEPLEIHPSTISISPSYGRTASVFGRDDTKIPTRELKRMLLRIIDPTKITDEKPDGSVRFDLSNSTQEYNKFTNQIIVRYEDKYEIIFEKEKIEHRLRGNVYD